MKTIKAKLSRRSFLLAVSAGTAASAIVAKKVSNGGSPQDNGIESQKGYQLTEHVRNYYRTAKI